MPVTINGNGSISGLSVGGLGSGVVNTATLANGAASGSKLTMPTGSVVQVQSVTKTDDFSVSANSTPQDVTGLTVNITPTSSSNKILVIVHVNATANNSYAGSGFTLVRVDSGTAFDIFKGDADGSTSRFTLPISGTNSDTGANNGYPDTHCGSFLDSPSSTNQLTYKIQVADYDNTNTIYVNRQTDSGTTSSRTANTSGITLMEIKG